MNIIDTRDLDKRLDELKAKRDNIDELREELNGLEGAELEEAEEKLEAAIDDFDQDEQDELKKLEEFESEIFEWCDGNTLIDDYDWVDYVKQLLDGCGDLSKNLPSYVVIDWDATADNIKADYSECEYQGTTYLYRNC